MRICRYAKLAQPLHSLYRVHIKKGILNKCKVGDEMVGLHVTVTVIEAKWLGARQGCMNNKPDIHTCALPSELRPRTYKYPYLRCMTSLMFQVQGSGIFQQTRVQ